MAITIDIFEIPSNEKMFQIIFSFKNNEMVISLAICYVTYDKILNLRSSKKYINGALHINHLSTKEDYRNMGFATLLLECIKNYCKNNNIIYITLDDFSANFNKYNNVYLNCNFNYIDNKFPEMIYYV